MRPTTDADAEYAILTTDVGRALLAEATAAPEPGPADLAKWRRSAPAAQVSAAVRLAEARRRGAAKFSRANRMWLDPVGLEQATAEVVARHKARRFKGARIVVDLCAGVGGDALALAERAGSVVAVDLDPGMNRRLVWNARVYEVIERLAAVRGRAQRFPVTEGMLVHIDPDRRAGERGRARTIEQYQPGLAELRAIAHSAAGGAIKLGPASDFADHFPAPAFEVELVSLGGECKEATVWFGALKRCARRATALPSGVTWTDRDGPLAAQMGVSQVGAWVFDPDPALVRSGLVDSFAAAHGLARLSVGVDYLTGEERVESGLVSAFEVLEVFPFDRKWLGRAVAKRGLGALEIKVRGIDLRPERLRTELRPNGPNAATLIVCGGTKTCAILARRAGGRRGAGS
jgi:hypothetical protein